MTEADRESILRANVIDVESRIGAACLRAGRDPSHVRLVAITKYVDVETAGLLLDLGVRDLGESRPQELWKKSAAIPDARWHLVGHLQRNKVEETLPLARLIHSVDSFRLLEAIETEARKQQKHVNVLLEFNLSGEAAKHGFGTSDVPDILKALRLLPFAHVQGLMTMAALAEEFEDSRPTFRALRELQRTLKPQMPEGHDVRHLSMGMTNDFEVAIEEGATMVRIGSALFRGLEGVPA